MLALALGLELRAIVGRTKERAAAVDANDDSNPGFCHGASFGILGFIFTLLAGIEILALSVVAGPDGFWNNLTVPLATAIVYPRTGGGGALRRTPGRGDRPLAGSLACRGVDVRVHGLSGVEFFSF